MGTQERKEREKEQRRQDILDAAEKVFFSRGVHLATMDEVAEAAELSKGTLYLYFNSKEDLYYAVCLRGMEIMHRMMAQAANKMDTGGEKILALGRAYFEFSQQFGDYFKLMMLCSNQDIQAKDQSDIGWQCHERGGKVIQMVAETLQLGIEDGSIQTDIHPRSLAYLCWSQLTGIIQMLQSEKLHMEKGSGPTPEQLIEDHFQLMRTALAPKEPPSPPQVK